MTFKWEQVEQQLKKALAEDPNAFDYDGVYEEMKGNQARPIHEDRLKREVDELISIFVGIIRVSLTWICVITVLE